MDEQQPFFFPRDLDATSLANFRALLAKYAPEQPTALVNSGTASIPSNNGASPHQVAHGLGVTPNFVSIGGNSAITPYPENATNSGGTLYLDPGAAADDTYIYIFNTCQSAVILSLPCEWYAAYIPT